MKQMLLVLFIMVCFLKTVISQGVEIIPINTDNTTMLFLKSNNKLYQVYYGEILAHPEDYEMVAEEYSQPLPLNIGGTRNWTIREAYPTFGNGNMSTNALRVTHADGNITTELVYLSHSQEVFNDKVITVFELRDTYYLLFVKLKFTAYLEDDVIEQFVTITNQEKGNIVLENMASSFIIPQQGDYYLTHFHGLWGAEMSMTEEKLTHGIKEISTIRGTRVTMRENPAFLLSVDGAAQEEYGNVYGGALAWTGNYRLQFDLDETSYCRILMGVNPEAGRYHLSQGESFLTPRAIWTFSNKGKGQVSRNYHDWSRKYNLQDGDRLRPVVLNSWEGAFFDFDEKVITDMMDNASIMGIEMFVLDDGWFGNKYPRNSDNAGLGDWEVNRKKLPNGLGHLSDYAQSKGLEFGIWVEPEMVNPKSELAEKHPEWIVQRPNRELMEFRNQLTLDISNPEVQDFVYNTVNNLLTSNKGIAYVKWDANRNIENNGSTFLSPDRQTNFWVDYTNGLYSVYKKLIKEHPDVIFQVCSSGGSRVEFGSMAYHHEFWASDNTDALQRLFIQWGTNHIYPPIATASHVSVVPNHITNRVTSLKFRFDVAMTGRLGVELQPKHLTDEEMVFTRNCISTYKKIVRPIIQLGDLYRGNSPNDPNGKVSCTYVSKSTDEAILFAYCTQYEKMNEHFRFRFNGLNPDKLYTLKELNHYHGNPFPYERVTFSGEFLMKNGLRLPLNKPLTSMVIYAYQTK